MVTGGNQHTRPTRSPQGSEGPIPEANKINAAMPYDFESKNLTAYGGLLPAGLVVQLHRSFIGDAGDGPRHPVRDPDLGVVQAGHDLVADADPEAVGSVGDLGVVDSGGGDELFPDDLVDRGGVVVGGHRHRLRHTPSR